MISHKTDFHVLRRVLTKFFVVDKNDDDDDFVITEKL